MGRPFGGFLTERFEKVLRFAMVENGSFLPEYLLPVYRNGSCPYVCQVKIKVGSFCWLSQERMGGQAWDLNSVRTADYVTTDTTT